MVSLRKLLLLLSLPFFAMGPSLAQATISATFSFTPVPAAPPVSGGGAMAPMAVPLLSDLSILVLGLLLVVAGIRTLRSRKDSGKMLSVMMLAAGLACGGFGADRAIATVAPIFIIGEEPGDYDCEGVVDQVYPLYHSGTAMVTNNCAVSGDVTTQYFGPSVCSLAGGTCGTLPPGESCVLPDEICPPP